VNLQLDHFPMIKKHKNKTTHFDQQTIHTGYCVEQNNPIQNTAA
jgi:hypothetical protein